MRKSLILTLALVVLAVCDLGMGAGMVGATADDVVITEQVVAGDPAAAEGVRVQMRADCTSHLHWDTHYAVGAPDGTYTDFTFSRKRMQMPEEFYGSIEFNSISGSSYSGAYDLSGEDGDENVPTGVKLFRAAAEQTDPGSRHTEVLYVRDYYEYFPLDVHCYFSGTMTNATEKQIADAMKAFFRIPVSEDYRVNVTVKKEADGAIYEMSMEDFGHAGLSIWTNSAVLDGVCYLTVNMTGDNGAPADTSDIPGGTGVYRLTYGGEDVSLETVFPLDQAAETIDLHLSADARKLLLTTVEDNIYYLTVIDLQTMTELQKLPVLEDAENNGYWCAHYEDDFLEIQFYSEPLPQFVVISAPEAEDYTVALRGSIDANDDVWKGYQPSIAMDFDGETLVIATQWWYWDDTGAYLHTPLGFLLSVYDASGLRYAGQYGTSLMDGPHQWAIGDLNCYFTNVDPLTVTLP